MSDEVGWIKNPNGRVSRDTRVHQMNRTEVCFVCVGTGSVRDIQCTLCSGRGRIQKVID